MGKLNFCELIMIKIEEKDLEKIDVMMELFKLNIVSLKDSKILDKFLCKLFELLVLKGSSIGSWNFYKFKEFKFKERKFFG